MNMKKNASNIIWGIVLLLLAAGLILSKLDPDGFGLIPNISLWRLLLGAAFLSMLVKSVFDFNFTGIFFSLAFLGIVFGKYLHIEALVPWTLLVAAALASVAFSLIFGNSFKHKRIHNHNFSANCQSGTIEGDYINESVRFSGISKYVRSDNLQRADLSCSFGGMEIYFDKVLIPSGTATIVVDSNFSGVEIYIPREWNVINNMTSFCGAVEVNDGIYMENAPTIILEGTNNFGGVEIKRV